MSERKSSRKNGRPTATKTAGNGDNELSDNRMAAAVVRDITRSNTELAKESMQLVAPQAAAQATIADGAADVTAGQSDVTDETKATGLAFGSFVQSVGMAVAQAQEELDKTLRKTADEISKQKIEVVHTYEQTLDDNGQLTNRGEAKMQSLPLSNYIMPTAYQWSRVYLEADMKISEFNSKSGFDIMSKSNSGGFRLGGGIGAGSGWNLGGSGGYSSSNAQTSVQNGYSMDSAVGSMHMEATLEPRADIELPKPIIIQKGPNIAVTVTKLEDLKETTPPKDQPARVIGKQATLKVSVKKADGTANSAVTLDYSVDQDKINHSVPDGLNSNENGEITIILKREGAAYDAATSLPVQVVVWLGLISKTLKLNM